MPRMMQKRIRERGPAGFDFTKSSSTPSPTASRPRPSHIDQAVSKAKFAVAGKSIAQRYPASTQRHAEAKVKRADPSRATAPKTITSPDPYASAAKAFKSPVHKGIGDAVRARNAAKASGDKNAYASAQNAVNKAYGVKKRHQLSRTASSVA